MSAVIEITNGTNVGTSHKPKRDVYCPLIKDKCKSDCAFFYFGNTCVLERFLARGER